MKITVKIDGYEIDSHSISYSYGINNLGSIDIGIRPQEIETYEAYGKPIRIELDGVLVYTGNIVSVEQNYTPMNRQTLIRGISNWYPYYKTGTIFYLYQKFTTTQMYLLKSLISFLNNTTTTQVTSIKFGEQLKDVLRQINKIVMTEPIGTDEYVSSYIKLIEKECPLGKLINQLGVQYLDPPQVRVNTFTNLFESALKQTNINFFNLLLLLGDPYQFILVNDKDTCSLIPNAPLVLPQKPYIELDEDISYVLEGFPLDIPTRAEIVFNRILSDGTLQQAYGQRGFYPSDKNKLTKLEKLLKHTQVYDKIYIIPNFTEDISSLLGQIASSVYADIVCKDRMMNINIPLNNTYKVGEVIGINANKRYTGRINSIRTSVELNQTQLQLTHVLSESEKEMLDLKEYTNPLYPNFKGI